MKRLDSRSVTAILILAYMGISFLVTLVTGAGPIAASVLKAARNSKGKKVEVVDEVIGGIEKGWNGSVFLRPQMVDAFGWISKSLGQRIIYDADDSKTVLLGSDGKLYYKGNVTGSDDDEQLLSNISKLVDFNEFCQERNTSFMFVIAPDKYNSTQVSLPLHVKDYMETTLWFAREAGSRGVDCLNVQELLAEETDHYSDGFFTTDHHWNIHTAFWACQKIVERMWPEDCASIDPNLFSTEIASTDYLGSMGVRTGRYLAGTDTVELIVPDYPTDFTVEYKTKTLKNKITREGPFSGSVIDSKNPGYNMYITSDNSYIHVVNNMNKNGRRVMLIKDSFGVPVAAWLALVCGELWVVDVRYAQEQSVCSMVDSNGIDSVVMIYNPGMLGSDMFRFREVSAGK